MRENGAKLGDVGELSGCWAILIPQGEEEKRERLGGSIPLSAVQSKGSSARLTGSSARLTGSPGTKVACLRNSPSLGNGLALAALQSSVHG